MTETPPFYGTPKLKEEGYHKKNSPCGCGHDLSMPYGNCWTCAEVDSSGNVIKRQIPYLNGFHLDTEDAYYESSVLDQGFTSYRNPLNYTNPSKGSTGPMFLSVRIEGATSQSNSFYSDASDINGTYRAMRYPFRDVFGRTDDVCYWFGYPCNQDKVYASAGFNKVEVFFGSGDTNWYPTESFPIDSPLYGVTSGLMDIYLHCRMEFGKYNGPISRDIQSRGSVCRDVLHGVGTSHSAIEKKVKVGTIIRQQKLLTDSYLNSDVLCNSWNELELTDFNISARDYSNSDEFSDKDALDEDMFDSSGIRIYITSLPNTEELFKKFVHHNNNGNIKNTGPGSSFGAYLDWPYYTYTYDGGSGPLQGYVFADTTSEYYESGFEPHLYAETTRDVYKTNPMPFAYKVTISNLQNKNCTSCTGLNGEHVLYLGGQDFYSKHGNDEVLGLGDWQLYGKHFYNKEVPLPSSLGYSGTLPCIYGIKCSGVIAENFGLEFNPLVSGGIIDFNILNSKHDTKVRYRRTVNDLPVHTLLNYDGGFTPSITTITGLSNDGSGIVNNMCEWSSANIKVEAYHDTDYTTNCFMPCLSCFSCKDGTMPSSITVQIGTWAYTAGGPQDLAGTYTLDIQEIVPFGGGYTALNPSMYTYTHPTLPFSLYFQFGCGGVSFAGGDPDAYTDIYANRFYLVLQDDLNCNGATYEGGRFIYTLPTGVTPLGDYYSRYSYGGDAIWGFPGVLVSNTDYYDCSNVDGDMVFEQRLPLVCGYPQTGPTVHITFNH